MSFKAVVSISRHFRRTLSDVSEALGGNDVCLGDPFILSLGDMGSASSGWGESSEPLEFSPSLELVEATLLLLFRELFDWLSIKNRVFEHLWD